MLPSLDLVQSGWQHTPSRQNREVDWGQILSTTTDGFMTIYDGVPFTLGGSGSAGVADGDQGMGINDFFPAPSTTVITFSNPVSRFGAYWAAFTDDPIVPVTVTLTFYNALNFPLDVPDDFQYSHPTGALQWHGWKAAPGELIARVEYSGSGVVLDSVQALAPEAIPEPSTLVLFALGLAGAAGCAFLRGKRR